MQEELENKPNPDEVGKDEQATEAGSNNAPSAEDLETIRAELAAERATLAQAQATLTEKDEAITALATELASVKTDRDLAHTDLAQLTEAHTGAVAKYLEAVRGANAALPADVITGETIAAIDASVGHARAIASAIRETMAAETKNARVPAGAPPRVMSLDGLTPKELIALGLSQQKGGNQ